MVAAPRSGGGLQVNWLELQQAARDLAGLSTLLRGLAAETPAAGSAAASACPGWEIEAASSGAAARWHRLVTTHAAAVAKAGENLAASAANYQLAETGLARKISAIGKPAAR
jgi:uncharacterized protein YukE